MRTITFLSIAVSLFLVTGCSTTGEQTEDSSRTGQQGLEQDEAAEESDEDDEGNEGNEGEAKTCKKKCMEAFHECREESTGKGKPGEDDAEGKPSKGADNKGKKEGEPAQAGGGASKCAHQKNKCMKEC